jgi:hypothetical protein
MHAIALISFVLGVLLPPWLGISLGYLTFRGISNLLVSEAVLRLGDIDIYLHDIFLVGLVFRFLFDAYRGKLHRRFVLSKLFPGVIAFIAVMGFSTLLAFFRSGSSIWSTQVVPLLRLIVVPLGPLLILSFYQFDQKSLRYGLISLRWSGYVIALTIYGGVFFGIGEINPTAEMDVLRYQGLLGDSVKLLLVPFILWETARRNVIGMAFLIMALLLTGGRWGVVSLGLGLMVLVAQDLKRRQDIKQYFAILAIILIGALIDWNGVFSRILRQGVIIDENATRRFATWMVGLRMGLEHWLTGAGYNAYPILFEQYCNFWKNAPPLPFDTFSQLIRTLVDGGILGLITYIWMISNFLHISSNWVMQKNYDVMSFLKATRATMLILLLLSPFVDVWLSPDSKVGYLLVLFVGMAASLQISHYCILNKYYPKTQNVQILTSSLKEAQNRL